MGPSIRCKGSIEPGAKVFPMSRTTAFLVIRSFTLRNQGDQRLTILPRKRTSDKFGIWTVETISVDFNCVTLAFVTVIETLDIFISHDTA
jgi:hypothetical protein